MDWAPGDLALCVRDFGGFCDTGGKCPVPLPIKGKVYHVAEVFVHQWQGGSLALRFGDLEDLGPGSGWNAVKFVKVTPPAADAFDREVIDALNSEPVHARNNDAVHNSCQREGFACASVERSGDGS